MPRRTSAVALTSSAPQSALDTAARSGQDRFSAETFSITSSARVPLLIILGLIDVIGALIAVSMAARGSVAHELVTCAPIVLFAMQLCGLYGIETSADLDRTAKGTLALGIVIGPLAVACAWIFRSDSLALSIAVGMFCGFGVAVLGRLACATAVLHFADRMIEKIVLIGSGLSRERPLRSLSLLNRKVKVVGQVVVGCGEPAADLLGRVDPDSGVLAGWAYPSGGLDRIVVLRAGLDDAQMTGIMRGLAALSVPIVALAELPQPDRHRRASSDAGWELLDAVMTPGALFRKRCLDFCLTALLVVFLAPVLLAISVCIRLETPGPALFRQTRYGRDNQPFTVFKFRTMFAQPVETEGFMQAVPGDKRVTRVGGFLRKTSLDELPQLFNVLNGTMSLVGPRPHVNELNRHFIPLIENYSARLRIAPGITGWAQVNGSRGATLTVEEMQRRVELDLDYIRHCSLTFDLWILLRTVFAVLSFRNAY